ncbi:hypothetical protein CLAIMM_14796 [Cladophialophora immunda]|nr:hypothetical protein CLAIMM_14796 [Cladophialophora immunda]
MPATYSVDGCVLSIHVQGSPPPSACREPEPRIDSRDALFPHGGWTLRKNLLFACRSQGSCLDAETKPLHYQAKTPSRVPNVTHASREPGFAQPSKCCQFPACGTCV